MLEGRGGSYELDNVEEWCSILLDNVTELERSTGIEDSMKLLARKMSALANEDSCVVLLWGVDDRFPSMIKYGKDSEGIGRLDLRGKAAKAVEEKKPSIVGTDDLGLALADMYRRTDFLIVPLASHEKAIGAAVLFSAGKRIALSKSLTDPLMIMGIQGAHAIGEFYDREELKRRNDELQRVYKIQRRITESIDLDKVTESIVENAPYITRLQYCLIFLLDPQERRIVSVKAPESLEQKFGKLMFDLDELIASKIAIKERRPLFIEDSLTYPYISRRVVEMMNSKSVIILPLVARDRVLGVMWLFSTDRFIRFDESDKRGAISLSDQAAIAIDNARIFKELEESYAKLKDLDRTKMEFFTLISHELRNPLAIIKGYTELLYDGTLGPLNDKQKDKLARIRENVDKLADMVGKMSEISSLEAKQYTVDRSVVSLGDMIEELTDTMGFLFENKHIELDLRIPENMPLVEVDRRKMEQVILNLLNNALKYTPDGGQVIIAARDRVADILVSVSDTGIGIPKKDLDKIFSGFYHSGYKLSYEYKGPGLGLAISRKIIEGHGGQIWAKSEVGNGSTFYFTIPKHPSEAGAAAGPTENTR